jgi:hypothetical protein
MKNFMNFSQFFKPGSGNMGLTKVPGLSDITV